MDLEIFNKLINNVKESNFVQNFMEELTDFIKNNEKTKQGNKYSKYWEYQNFIEDNVAATIGISRWSADVKYKDELKEEIERSILKVSEEEGPLYRKKHRPNGSKDKQTYSIDKYENGKVEYLILTGDKVPKGLDNEDIIFKYKSDGSIEIRNDLKEKIIKIASENTEYLKEEENKRISDYKQEGHTYKVIEDDGYVFLKDLTQQRDYIIEDIDFIVDNYQGDGEYQVIDGVYKKIINSTIQN